MNALFGGLNLGGTDDNMSQGSQERVLLTEEQRNSLPEKTIEAFREAFDLFDLDRSGTISRDEIQKALRSLGQEITMQEIETMMHGVDVDDSGSIDFEEFITVMYRLQEGMDSEAELVEVFRVLDQDGDGLITKSDLREVIKRTGSELTNEDIDEMMQEADQTGDGHINIDEFMRIILSRY